MNEEKNSIVTRAGFSFGDLIAYQKAKSFYSTIQSLVGTIDITKTQKDQLSRAALSIPLNIAESTGRIGPRDRRRFFVIARGSVFECAALIDVLRSEGILSELISEKLMGEASEISRILFVMINKLGKGVKKRTDFDFLEN